MKLSETRKDATYMAIHLAVTDCRIALAKDGLSATHDAQIAQLERTIWHRLCDALNIQGDR